MVIERAESAHNPFYLACDDFFVVPVNDLAELNAATDFLVNRAKTPRERGALVASPEVASRITSHTAKTLGLAGVLVHIAALPGVREDARHYIDEYLIRRMASRDNLDRFMGATPPG